jgi:hypothetical protein
MGGTGHCRAFLESANNEIGLWPLNFGLCLRQLSPHLAVLRAPLCLCVSVVIEATYLPRRHRDTEEHRELLAMVITAATKD